MCPRRRRSAVALERLPGDRRASRVPGGPGFLGQAQATSRGRTRHCPSAPSALDLGGLCCHARVSEGPLQRTRQEVVEQAVIERDGGIRAREADVLRNEQLHSTRERAVRCAAPGERPPRRARTKARCPRSIFLSLMRPRAKRSSNKMLTTCSIVRSSAVLCRGGGGHRKTPPQTQGPGMRPSPFLDL